MTLIGSLLERSPRCSGSLDRPWGSGYRRVPDLGIRRLGRPRRQNPPRSTHCV